MSKKNKASGESCLPGMNETCCAWIYGGGIGWPSADAAYFAELAGAGLPTHKSQSIKPLSLSLSLPIESEVLTAGHLVFSKGKSYTNGAHLGHVKFFTWNNV